MVICKDSDYFPIKPDAKDLLKTLLSLVYCNNGLKYAILCIFKEVSA